jgi:GntR family transcriptional repressor for pyruvate dehydrogenase complex
MRPSAGQDGRRRRETRRPEMAAADKAGDVDAFVAADLAFHQTVLHAAGNGLIAALLDPLSRLLVPARRQTSEFDDIRRHALDYRGAILEAKPLTKRGARCTTTSSRRGRTRGSTSCGRPPGQAV